MSFGITVISQNGDRLRIIIGKFIDDQLPTIRLYIDALDEEVGVLRLLIEPWSQTFHARDA